MLVPLFDENFDLEDFQFLLEIASVVVGSAA